MTSEQAEPPGWPRSGGSATPLPPPSDELRQPDGRLAHWVFGLPVAELRAGHRSAVYFDRARRILAGEGADTRVTVQVFQRGDGVVACGIDEALAVLALGAGAFTDQATADHAFGEHLRARNQARRARPRGGPAYLEAVRLQVDSEIALDQLWRRGGAELEVRALRDGDRIDAWEPVVEITGPYRLFAHLIPDVPLVALVDFDNDCVGTSLACARAFGERLWGVRLDTASTLVDRSLWDQLGDFDPTGVNPQLVRNVRRALDTEGFQHVRVICSGGFNAERITAFERAGVPVDSYAGGSSLLKGASDYTADVVLREGEPCAKVGRHYRPSERLQPVDLAAP